MDKIKSAVSPYGVVGRIASAIMFGGMGASVLIMALVKFLEFCLLPSDVLAIIEKVLWGAGIPLTGVIIAVYIFRILRRRYAFSYAIDCCHGLREGPDTCPRCGSTVSEKTGT